MTNPLPASEPRPTPRSTSGTTLQSLCVFCGSSSGSSNAYEVAATRLGALLAARNIRLVYGGGNMGLMGTLARACRSAGGKVTGIIPERLSTRVKHAELDELFVTSGMHERKALMYERSDGFIVLPGGIGTMEEFFETYTWQQIGYHQKPVGLLQCEGFFDPVLALLDHLCANGFLKKAHRDALVVATQPEELITSMEQYIPTNEHKLPEQS